MSLENLFEQGFLKRIPPSTERAKKSLEIAERYLDSAKKNFDMQLDDIAVIVSYSAAFHAARAVLFVDGVAERSHFAIRDYLREKHARLGIGAIESFDLYRKFRHSVAYGLDSTVAQKDAKDAISFAEHFVAKVKEYLKLR